MARYVADGVSNRLLSELHNTIDSGTDIRFHQRMVDRAPVGGERSGDPERAFESVSDAVVLAHDCMDDYGGRASYVPTKRDVDYQHVVMAWDGGLSSGGPNTTVWLERLALVAKASV